MQKLQAQLSALDFQFKNPDSGVERSRVTSSETELTTREGEKCCELSWPARKSHVTNCNIN